MNRAIGAWDRFWFSRQSPFDLGLCRLLFVGFAFALFASADFSAWATVPDVFWMPHGYFVWLDDPVASAGTLRALQWLWKGALLLGAVGLFTRPSLAVAAAIGVYLLGLGNNFGKIGHGEAILVWVLLVLTCSRCGHAVSIDAWWHRRRQRPAREPSGHYRWPVRSVWMLTSLMLASAGYSKLYNSGLEWLDPENLGTMMIFHQYIYGGRSWTDLGPLIAQIPLLTGTLALGTLVLELGMPLAMFSSRLRALWVPGALAMLIAFPALLGPFFTLLIAAFVFWVPWRALVDRLHGFAQSAPGSA